MNYLLFNTVFTTERKLSQSFITSEGADIAKFMYYCPHWYIDFWAFQATTGTVAAI